MEITASWQMIYRRANGGFLKGFFPGARARFFQLRGALEQHLAAEERCLTSPPSEMSDYNEAVGRNFGPPMPPCDN